MFAVSREMLLHVVQFALATLASESKGWEKDRPSQKNTRTESQMGSLSPECMDPSPFKGRKGSPSWKGDRGHGLLCSQAWKGPRSARAPRAGYTPSSGTPCILSQCLEFRGFYTHEGILCRAELLLLSRLELGRRQVPHVRQSVQKHVLCAYAQAHLALDHMSIFAFLGSLAELLAPCRRRRVSEPEEEDTTPEQQGHNELSRHWLSGSGSVALGAHLWLLWKKS